MSKLIITLLVLAATGVAMAQQPAPQQPAGPQEQFNQGAMAVLKQQRDQANDQVVALGAQLMQARQALQDAQKELADLKAKEAPPKASEKK